MRFVWMPLLILSLLGGCKTVFIEQRAPIAVPAGLNANDVQVAVLYDLANQNIPADLTPGERIANNAMKALFPFGYQSVSDRKPGWYPEAAEQGVIYAGFEKGPYYLRVAIEYSDSAIQTRFIESRNLSQTNTRIHKSAVVWIDQLEMRIRRALGQLAAGRALEGRELK
jgi:hypothetical protein